MENDLNDYSEKYNKEENEDILNNQKDIKSYNINTKKEKNSQANSEYISLFDKYKSQNEEVNINTNSLTQKDNENENIDDIKKDKDMIQINNNFTKQINEIISKNFKNEIVNMNQNIYMNPYPYLNSNNNNNTYNNKYIELDRERKLLLLKNIELEKEINNLNNFVDIGTKFNQNKINNKPKKSAIESYIKTKNKKINKKEEINYKKEITESQNIIKILDKRINELKKEINMNYSINGNKCKEKIKEVKIWRETFYEEFYKCKNLLKDFKDNLNKDKNIYYDVISKMKQKSNDNINTIYENYKGQIIDNDKKLNFLKKENDKLINKENKVKEIYLYNFK